MAFFGLFSKDKKESLDQGLTKTKQGSVVLNVLDLQVLWKMTG